MKILQNRTICMVTISTNGTSCNLFESINNYFLILPTS
jgi:hypothetical protein